MHRASPIPKTSGGPRTSGRRATSDFLPIPQQGEEGLICNLVTYRLVNTDSHSPSLVIKRFIPELVRNLRCQFADLIFHKRTLSPSNGQSGKCFDPPSPSEGWGEGRLEVHMQKRGRVSSLPIGSESGRRGLRVKP